MNQSRTERLTVKSFLAAMLCVCCFAAKASTISISSCWDLDKHGAPRINFDVANNETGTVAIPSNRVPWSINAAAYFLYALKDGAVIDKERIYRIEDAFYVEQIELKSGGHLKGRMDLGYYFDLGKNPRLDNLVALWSYSVQRGSGREDFYKAFFFDKPDDRCPAKGAK